VRWSKIPGYLSNSQTSPEIDLGKAITIPIYQKITSKLAIIFSLETLLICPNLHASFGVCGFGQQISANLQVKFAAEIYGSLIPATLWRTGLD